MSNRIVPDNHYVEGESITWKLEIYDENGDPKDLTGGSASWYLVENQGDENSNSLLSDADSGIDLSLDGSNGVVTLSIAEGATEDLDGEQWHRFVVDDSATGRKVYHGDFPIEPK